MRKLKETARLLLDFNLGVRAIARACDISTSTAHIYVEKLKELGVPYAEIVAMGDDELEELLFPGEKRCREGVTGFCIPVERDDKERCHPFSFT